MTAGRRLCALALAGVALVGLTALAAALHVAGRTDITGGRLAAFVDLVALAGLIYGGAVLLVWRGAADRRALWAVLTAAAALRAVTLLTPPFLSTDVYRYIWDGRVQLAGINPYRYIPADPALAALRDPGVYAHINRADYAPTIYPPAAQMVFAGIAAVSQTPLAVKATMLAFEAVGIATLLGLLRLAGLPRERVLIYAWNPVPAWEFAGNGHVDALSVCFVALAMLAAARRRSVLSGAALGFAVLAKFLPGVLLPALWRRWDWRFLAAFAAVIAGLYACYISVGRQVLGFLSGYAAEEGMQSGKGVYYLAQLGRWLPLPAQAGRIYFAVVLLALAVLGARMVFGAEPADAPARTLRLSGNALLLMTVLIAALAPRYPWYYPWLLVPACLVPSAAVIWLVAASVSVYANALHDPLWWPALLYGPFAALAALDFWRAARAEHCRRDFRCRPPP
ncbi:MAG: DUF2029 domain-containing protein [Acidisphaera sp.]|nr:DUF2029 domain-containing protein [Acidisphaera sp.]